MGVWIIAIYGASWLRYDFVKNPVFVCGTMTVAIIVVIAHIAVGAIMGPYAVGHDRASFEETIDITQTVAVTAAGLFAIVLIVHPVLMPRSIPVMAGALALTGMFAIRFVVRTWRNWRSTSAEGDRRVIVFEAGEAGRHVVRNMIRDPHSGFALVAILDDDRVRGRLTVDGVRVR